MKELWNFVCNGLKRTRTINSLNRKKKKFNNKKVLDPSLNEFVTWALGGVVLFPLPLKIHVLLLNTKTLTYIKV
jgi:hypothetical protein